MLFSATMPEAVVKISEKYMNNAEQLLLDEDEITVDKIKQVFYGSSKRDKFTALVKMLKKNKVKRGIIFVNTKTWADTLTKMLRTRQFKVDSLHSNHSQKKRTQVIEAFKQGKFDLLIATDVAARGLHINDVTHVFNYDLPRNPKDYVHRIGRTGRAGAEGTAVSLLTQQDDVLLRAIEREIQMFLQVQPIDNKFDGTIAAKELEKISDDQLEELAPVESMVPNNQQIAAEVSTGGGWDRWD
jgi:ATP-dependent RNA helicase DeaD